MIGVLAILLAFAATRAAPKPEPISMRTTFSDTSLILHDWQIAPDGVITATFREPATIVPIPTKMVTRRSAPDSSRYLRIAELVEQVLHMSANNMPCQLGAIDQYTYTVAQPNRPAVSVYDGCRETKTRAYAAVLGEADAQIARWIAAAPVVAERTERP